MLQSSLQQLSLYDAGDEHSEIPSLPCHSPIPHSPSPSRPSYSPTPSRQSLSRASGRNVRWPTSHDI